MPTNFIGVLLSNSPNYTVNTGFSTQLYDATGSQTITVQTGASLSLLGAMGANTVRLSGNASAWQVYRDGSTAIFVNTDGSRVELGANATAQTLQFDDGTRALSINTSGATPAVVLGSQTLGLSAAAIGADTGTPTTPTEPGVGSTVKTPWTLVMHASDSPYSYPTNGGIFTSDGTAAATGLTTMEGLGSAYSYSSDMGVRFITNADQSKAFFYKIGGSWSGSYGSGFTVSSVGVTDGTAAGNIQLMSAASGSYLPGNFATVFNSQLILAGGDSSGETGKVLVSDGTVAGTTLDPTAFAVPAFSYPGSGARIDNAANQSVWFAGNSAPYGRELVSFSYGPGETPTASLVKDIYSGSSSGLGNYYEQLTGAVLPNGKLVFGATDGVNGNEVWVSDGTETGTVLLSNLAPGNQSSYPYNFTNFGTKIVFSANVQMGYSSNDPAYVTGRELVFTDGTLTGTTVLDVSPGLYSSEAQILGQVDGLLYFTANVPGNGVGLGIFSTDGTSFNRLADINSSASLLGWDASNAFFRVSDTAHGDELWAADLVSGGFALVQDILPGSGSALANDYGSSAFMVGGKLVFRAYTSATAQSFFMSDGTNAGTVQLTASLPTLTRVLGNTLVYANADGVFSVAAGSATTPTAVELISASAAPTSNGQSVSNAQSDSDQLFMQLVNGDLYASNGSTAGTVKLAGAVSNFKMVAEDALFFIQTTTTTSSSSQALWYSDGTVAGTRFIEDLPSGNYDLANAVALRTAGVALPPDTVAPLFASAAVMGNTLTLTYTDANGLNAASPPAASAFALGGTAATVSSVTVNSSAKTATLTLSVAVQGTDVVTVSYTDPTAGNDAAAIQDSAGNDAASLASQPVVNQSVDRMAPLFSGAVVNGATLTLSYADANALDATNTPAASAFSLSGTTATVSSVAVNSAAKTVVLTLSAPVQVSDVILVSYADPTTGNDAAAIQDSTGNDASSLISRPVTNQTLDTIAPVISSASVSGNSLTLTYTDTSPLDAANPPTAAAFSLAGTSATVSTVTVNATAKTVVLGLSAAVNSTDVVTLNYTDPTGGNDVAAIQDSAGNDAATLGARAVTNQTADNVAPVFGSARVNGNTLILSYTDASLLDSANAPAATAFTLAGTTATVSSVSVNTGASGSKTVTLTLSSAVSSTDVITLSYTDPTTGNDVNAIQDSLGNDAASLVNQTVMNTTSVKAPWTLLFANFSGIYSSDGTSSGTGYISDAYIYGQRWTVNADYTTAVLQTNGQYSSGYPYTVYGTNGSVDGTQLLAENIYIGSDVYLMGNRIVIADGGSTTEDGLITDGTVAGTTVVANLPSGIVDAANQAIWHGISTVPYGYELFRTVITDSGATTAMVKDIWSGSSSGLDGYSWDTLQGVVLPNGKLVFRANDGVHGTEAWVSDGTDAGTFMLANLLEDNTYGQSPSNLSGFGNTVVFTQTIYPDASTQRPYAGNELVFSDGTASGTTVLDVNSGQESSNPTILGQANSLLYFTATAPNVSSVTTLGIFSTDGTSLSRLADINSDASLLGWNASKAFFRVSDVTHGDELWAADLVSGSFALVKDILAGTGSALGATDASNSFMVGGKLAFTAYTSATAQNFFLSDGTDAGTVQLGNLTTATQVVGNTLVFADATGVFAVDAAATTPSALALVSGTLGTSGLQADADQVFFTLASGDLYTSNGSTAGTVKLADSVTSVKLVAENALYFIQDTAADPAALWYSDGTAAGTRYIEDLPGTVVDLSNAVAIVTVGVMG